MKIKEPEFTYNSCSQLAGLKRKLIASIEKEEDVEVLLQYASVMRFILQNWRRGMDA